MLVYKKLPPNSQVGTKRKGQNTQNNCNMEMTSQKKHRSSNGDTENVVEIQESSNGNGISVLNGAVHLHMSVGESDKLQEVINFI